MSSKRRGRSPPTINPAIASPTVWVPHETAAAALGLSQAAFVEALVARELLQPGLSLKRPRPTRAAMKAALVIVVG